MEKAKIIYPCLWSFKIIGTNKKHIEKDIKSIMQDCVYDIKLSKKNDKYTSMNMSTMVGSQIERNRLFTAIKDAPSVTMVI